jgi:DNA replication and repair protein RecF
VVEADTGRQRRIRVAFGRNEGKRVFVDGAALDRLSDLVGVAPAVVFSPEDHVLTSGPPEERRRLLNNVMSQERPAFMSDLATYRRSVRQRNELLGRTGRGVLIDSQEPVFLAWTAEYISSAARIVIARQRFVEAFREYLARAYVLLGESVERPEMTYATIGDMGGLNEADLAELLRKRVERDDRREREAGRTLIGPHRDDLIFRLNDLDVRRYASHGQHRTFGVALKIAQYLYLHDRLHERPILLLDDVFGILDPDRTEVVLELLQSDSLGQSLITATHAEPFTGVSFDCVRHQKIEVHAAAGGSKVALPCRDDSTSG